MSSHLNSTVIVVGGGVSGLYCARALAQAGYRVHIMEATKRLGGRIETGELSPGPDTMDEPFKAEFGPMRFELELQDHFRRLCDEFNIEFESFPPPTPAKPPIEYPLYPDECSPDGKAPSALELLKLGIYRMFGHNPRIVDHGEDPASARVELSEEGQKWLNDLSDADGSFEELRKNAVMAGTRRPLYSLGFWNALYLVLSPMAVANILHFGSFYHLLPDNPNAVEWAIFWLRLFQLGDRPLSTIPAGVSAVTQALVQDLVQDRAVTVALEREVVALSPSTEGGRVEVTAIRGSGSALTVSADHVILALPKKSLMAVSENFPAEIRADLGSVIAFPLLKVFCVTDTPPWWTEQPRPQEGVWVAPTRELHYFPTDRSANRTLVLFYTDQPATSYWQTFLADREHHREAERNKNNELKRALATVLFRLHWEWANGLLTRPRGRTTFSIGDRRVLDALSTLYEELLTMPEDDPAREQLASSHPALVGYPAEILFRSEKVRQWQLDVIGDYAIRDWSCPPFGAGCHAWAPGVKSWEVRRRLRAFGFEGQSGLKNLHVCGEAYSDYQGFIEGALRSASHAVDVIIAIDSSA